MKIYDVFLFFNEFDLLDIRMDELDGVVDKHILIEAPYTFTMKSKPYFYYDQGWAQRPKIECIPIPKESFEGMKPLNRNDIHYVERFQRNYVKGYLETVCKSDDVIIFSDIDEIPTVHQVAMFIGSKKGSARFKTKLYRYFYNLYFQLWASSHFFRWNEMKNWINDLDSIRTKCKPDIISESCGWHFSAVGDYEFIKYKLENKSSSNEKRVKERLKIKDYIKTRINDRLHPFKTRGAGSIVSVDDMPDYIKCNENRFHHLLLKD
jgi:beta-1,4-mannosyl-glycoprotein beta-1,4-N-acetylglucosaminyltransferase